MGKTMDAIISKAAPLPPIHSQPAETLVAASQFAGLEEVVQPAPDISKAATALSEAATGLEERGAVQLVRGDCAGALKLFDTARAYRIAADYLEGGTE